MDRRQLDVDGLNSILAAADDDDDVDVDVDVDVDGDVAAVVEEEQWVGSMERLDDCLRCCWC